MPLALLTIVPCCLSDPNGDLDPDLNQNFASSTSYCNYETAKDSNDLRANPCKNRPKSPIRGKAQKIKIALLLQTGRH